MRRRYREIAAATLFAALVLAGCGPGIDPSTAVAQAQVLVDSGKPGEARILLKNALVKQAQLSGARELLARIALDEGDARAAGDELAALDGTAANGAASAADSAEAAALRVQVGLETGRVEEAQRTFDAAWDVLQDPQRALLHASLLTAQGKGAEALLLLRALQVQYPGQPQVVVQVATTLSGLGNRDEAVAELDRYLATEPAQPADVLRLRGELVLQQGMAWQAAEDLRAAVRAAPAGWPRVRRLGAELALASALLADGQPDAARTQIEHVDSTWPGLLGTQVLQAQLALLEGHAQAAVQRLRPLLDAAPDNLRLQRLLAEARVRAGDVTGAIDLLEKAVAAAPGDAATRRTLASLWARQGRPDRVIALLGNEPAGAQFDDLLATARQTYARAQQDILALGMRLAATPDDPALRAELARAQVAVGDPTAALATLGPLPERGFTPSLAAARMSALLANGDEFGVNSLVDRLLDPTSGADVEVLLATTDVAQHQRREAVVSRLLERATVVDGNSEPVQLRRASLDLDAHRYDEAGRTLQAILARTPAEVAAGLALARVMDARGDAAGAHRTLEALVQAQTDPRATAAAAAAAGNQLLDARQFEAARVFFQRATQEDPGEAGYWFDLGRAQFALQQGEAARASFEHSAQLQPALPATQAAVRLGLQQGQAAQAAVLAEALVMRLAGDADAWRLAGEARQALGQLEAARAAYAQAFTLRPDAASAAGEYQMRRRLGDARAAAPLAAWLARAPQDQRIRRVLGEYYLATGNTAAATTQFEMLLRQLPGDLATLNNLAWLLRESDNGRAKQLALQAQAIAPDNPAVADTLGMVYLAGNEPAAALPVLALAATAEPDDPTMQYHYALALRRVGQTAEARTVLQRLLKEHDDFADRREARRLLEEI